MKAPGRKPSTNSQLQPPSSAAGPALAPEYALMAAAHMNSLGRLFTDPNPTDTASVPAQSN